MVRSWTMRHKTKAAPAPGKSGTGLNFIRYYFILENLTARLGRLQVAGGYNEGLTQVAQMVAGFATQITRHYGSFLA